MNRRDLSGASKCLGWKHGPFQSKPLKSFTQKLVFYGKYFLFEPPIVKFAEVYKAMNLG
jgi:hypothetical protein